MVGKAYAISYNNLAASTSRKREPVPCGAGSAHATSLPPRARYDDVLPRDYWEPAARLSKLADLGVDEAVLFPN